MAHTLASVVFLLVLRVPETRRVSRRQPTPCQMRKVSLPGDCPVDRAAPDAQAPGDLHGADTLGMQSARLIGLDPRRWRPALIAAGEFRGLDAFALPLQHYRALELRDAAQHVQDQLAGGRARIQVHVED